MSDTCKSCGLPIRWATTENGKPIPLDAEPCENGNIQIYSGDVAHVVAKGEKTPYGVPRYVSHYATCPHAQMWRKPKSPAPAEAFTGFVFTGPGATGKEGAEKFAARYWETPREIETWDGSRFRLVDGIAWYQPRLTPRGVEIWRVG